MNVLDLLPGVLFACAAGWIIHFAGSRVLAAGMHRASSIPGVRKPMKTSRERRLERDLPDALERIASAMSAGHSLQQSLAAVAGNPRHPLAGLIGAILGRVRAGLSLEDALRGEAASFRRRSVPLALLTMASSIRSGSNLVESLNLLARVCRDRESLRRKIDSLTAQSRLQGIILALVPVFFLLALALVSPASFRSVVADPLGRKIIAAALSLEALGALAIRGMVNKEVF